jgi:DNA-binding beta-propeller fold protein YncE
MRPKALLLAVALVAAACAAPAAPTATDVVFFESAHGITVTDNRGTVLSTDATVANPDRTRLYAVRADRLVTFDPVTNRELAGVTVPRGRTARVVSTDGTRVALTDGDRKARARTTIVVADTRSSRTLDLAGNFEPEAFSTDNTHLFVLEYLPANAPTRYRVRKVDVTTGEVQPLLLRDKTIVPAGAEEEMRGEGRQAVLSPDRSRLYTLYLHQGDHEHTRDLLRGTDGRTVHAFVHVLSLTEGWAYCLDLPDPFGSQPAEAHALTVSPDGARLYVGELTTKRVAVADTESLTVTTVATLTDDETGGDGAAMAMSPDGATLYVGSANLLRRVDATTLRVSDTWRLPKPVHGVAPDDGHVYVGQGDRIARVDATTGRVVDTFAASGMSRVLSFR